MRSLASQLAVLTARLGLQAKFKILVSFYQVCATLVSVYGVRLHPSFTGWLDVLAVFNLDALQLFYPSPCIGSMVQRLLVNAFWPYALVLAVSAAIGAHAFGSYLPMRKSGRARSDLPADVPSSASVAVWPALHRCVYALIFIFYLVLPVVSRNIFTAASCESLSWDDEAGEQRSYLIADPSVNCNQGLNSSWDNRLFRRLQPLFWALFVLWPVLVPVGFLALLFYVRVSVVERRISGLANACRFLWRDYAPGFFYWVRVEASAGEPKLNKILNV
jgi:hypothetical protein